MSCFSVRFSGLFGQTPPGMRQIRVGSRLRKLILPPFVDSGHEVFPHPALFCLFIIYKYKINPERQRHVLCFVRVGVSVAFKIMEDVVGHM